jgi:hypothetical protein
VSLAILPQLPAQGNQKLPGRVAFPFQVRTGGWVARISQWGVD